MSKITIINNEGKAIIVSTSDTETTIEPGSQEDFEVDSGAGLGIEEVDDEEESESDTETESKDEKADDSAE